MARKRVFWFIALFNVVMSRLLMGSNTNCDSNYQLRAYVTSRFKLRSIRTALRQTCERRPVFRAAKQPIICSDAAGEVKSLDQPSLAGIWSILTGDAKEAEAERMILRVDGQVAGGPTIRSAADLNVSWACDQKAAGGKWREYAGMDGKRRLEVTLIIPASGSWSRGARRQALYFDGFVLNMLEYDSRTDKMDPSPKLRVFGNMSRGELDGDPSLRYRPRLALR